MGRPNHLKEKLAAGGNAVGCVISLRGADTAEVLAQAGFDFFLIDHEHGLGAFGDAVDQMRAMGATTTTSLVRVPLSEPAYAQRILDAGAEGILFPSVESKAEAERAVQACFFPPEGTRGAGPRTRGSRYGYDSDFPALTRESLLVAVAVESESAIRQIPEIAKVTGLDAIFIGPRDLSASIGKLNDFRAPELLSLLKEAEDRILETGKYLGSALYPGLSLSDMHARGHRMVVAGSDTAFLVDGARLTLQPGSPSR